MTKHSFTLVGITVSAILLGLTGCASYNDPSAYNSPSTAYPTGAATVAMTGTSPHVVPGSMVSGATGNATPAPGTALGYPDTAKIRTEFQNTGINVVQLQNRDDVLLIMPNNVQFAPGSSQLNPVFEHALNSVATVMKNNPNVIVELPGHTDSTENAPLALSAARTIAVANYLSSQGVEHQRIDTRAFANSIPNASNATKEGHAQNRRVEVILHTA
jgi:outer membrane protein OmpA-like peptidoglycan-associated protein